MGFSQQNGYVPSDITTIMGQFMLGVNDKFGTSYTAETFIATNHYKYFYAIAQRVQANEIKTSEIFALLQQYFAITNERISRPVVTPPGIIEKFLSEEYVASVKPMIVGDAGKISICVDTDDGVRATGLITITNFANLVSGTDDKVTINGTDFTAQVGAATPGAGTFQAATSNDATAASLALQINSHATASLVVRALAITNVVHITARNGGTAGNAYTLAYTDNDTNVGATKSGATLAGGTTNVAYAANKLAINTIIKDCVAGGVVSQGDQASTIVLTNDQSFDFKFCLPNRISPLLRLTTVLSENNQSVIKSTDDVKQALIDNIAAKYALGRNFEPQRYFSVADAPWAASVLLEYSLNGGSTYLSAIYDAAFDDLFEIDLANISVVET